jgi:hypothetical protein
MAPKPKIAQTSRKQEIRKIWMINFSEIYFENVDTIKMEITGTNLKM